MQISRSENQSITMSGREISQNIYSHCDRLIRVRFFFCNSIFDSISVRYPMTDDTYVICNNRSHTYINVCSRVWRKKSNSGQYRLLLWVEIENPSLPFIKLHFFRRWNGANSVFLLVESSWAARHSRCKNDSRFTTIASFPTNSIHSNIANTVSRNTLHFSIWFLVSILRLCTIQWILE